MRYIGMEIKKSETITKKQANNNENKKQQTPIKKK